MLKTQKFSEPKQLSAMLFQTLFVSSHLGNRLKFDSQNKSKYHCKKINRTTKYDRK